jgi:hypothetical protein
MLDRAVLTGSIHGLKHQQQGPAVLGVELVLQRGHPLNPIRQRCLSSLLVADLGVEVLISGWPSANAMSATAPQSVESRGDRSRLMLPLPWLACGFKARVPAAQPDLASPAENNHV